VIKPEVQARVREARAAEPTRGRLLAVRRLLADWTELRLASLCQRLGVSEPEATARLRELGVATFTRGGETWLRGARARWTVADKPEPR
jgi:hypothetical protein